MKIYRIIRTAVYLALSVLVMVFAPKIAEEVAVLRYFIGGLMIFYGVEEIIFTTFKHEKHYSINHLYRNLIEIIIGITLIIFVKAEEVAVAYAIVCVSWAIWSILRETQELIEVTKEIKHKNVITKIVTIANLLESLVVIALSLTMIMEPGHHHALTHLYLLGVELITKVLFPIILLFAEKAEEKKKNVAGEE